jgi:hypothetical protein
MLTLFMLLAAAGGILRLALALTVKAALGRVYWRPASLSRGPCGAGRTALSSSNPFPFQYLWA